MVDGTSTITIFLCTYGKNISILEGRHFQMYPSIQKSFIRFYVSLHQNY